MITEYVILSTVGLEERSSKGVVGSAAGHSGQFGISASVFDLWFSCLSSENTDTL